MSSQITAAIVAFGLVGAGVASANETRSVSALPTQSLMAVDGIGAGAGAGAGGECRVDVIRSGAPGSADVTRQVFNNGSCVCTITTGPSGNANGSAEAIVGALLRDRTCDGAPPAGEMGTQASGAAGGGGGTSGAVLTALVAAGGAAGLIVALGKDSKG